MKGTGDDSGVGRATGQNPGVPNGQTKDSEDE